MKKTIPIFSIFALILCACSQSNYLVRYEDYAPCGENDSCYCFGYKNTKGKIVIPPKYFYADDTFHTVAMVCENWRFKMIDRNENTLLEPFIFDNGPDYIVEGVFRFVENGKMGFADSLGNKIIPAQFDMVYPFRDGIAEYAMGGHKEYDPDGEHWYWAGEYESGYVNHVGQRSVKILEWQFGVDSVVASCGNNRNNKASKTSEVTEEDLAIVNSVGKQAIAMLTEFYTIYITESDKRPYNPKSIEALINKCTTKEFRKKWRDAELDYDPILNAQDCDINWIKTLEINPVADQKDVYTIRYRYNEENKQSITIHLVNRSGEYLIDDIEGLDTADSPPKTIIIEGKAFSVSVKDKNCLYIWNEKDELIFEKCEEYWMLQLHDQKKKNTLPLTIISGKHAIDTDFRYTDFKWETDTVTYYPPGKSAQMLKMSIALADFDFDKIIEEYQHSLYE